MTIPWWMVTQGVVDLALLGSIAYLLIALRHARAATASSAGPETQAAIAEFTALAESLLTAWKASPVHHASTQATEPAREDRSTVRPFDGSVVLREPALSAARAVEPPRPTASPSVPGTTEPPNASGAFELPRLGVVREVPAPREPGEGMPLSRRLAILRQLEKGLRPEAVARDVGLPVGEVELVARLYGRNGHGRASSPGARARAEAGAGREMWGRPQAAWTHGGVVVHGAEWA